jgi:hypothetical protein
MERTSGLTHLIIRIANQVPDCTMEDLQTALPYCTWNQVFFEVDRMSRNGQLLLSYKKSGSYRIRVAEGGTPHAVDSSLDR